MASRRPSAAPATAIPHQLGHEFVKKTFKSSSCGWCGDSLWGIASPCYICDICHYAVHEKCMQKTQHACVEQRIDALEEQTKHTWRVQKARRKYFCNVCRSLIESDRALCCTSCGTWSHLLCRIGALNDCRATATYVKLPTSSRASGLRTTLARHHWVEGNYSSKAQCAACKKPCANTHCLFGFQCTWCLQAVHPKCLESIDANCDMGRFHGLILPPFAVSINSTLPDVEMEVDVSNSLWLQDNLAEVLEGGYREIEINEGLYRGEGASNSKRILIHEKWTTQEVIARALHAFGIHDNASYYYLMEVKCPSTKSSTLKGKPGALVPSSAPGKAALPDPATGSDASPTMEEPWACRRCQFTNNQLQIFCELCGNPKHDKATGNFTEQEMDMRECPAQAALQPQQPGWTLLFYLRSHAYSKALRDGKGLIRVFLADDLCEAAPSSALSKTLSVSMDTTVADIVRQAKTKFGLTHDLSALCLQEVQLQLGVKKRIMADDEFPLRTKLGFQEHCLNDRMLRFYLRLKRRPGTRPASLFLYNIPQTCTPSSVSNQLALLLESEEGAWFIDLLLPSHGFVVICFESPEDADSAASVLRLSTMDGQQLKVAALPDIQVQEIPQFVIPLLVFVNTKSGGGQGIELYSKLSRLLNPHQVFDLTTTGPMAGISAFRRLPSYKILVCGGDGTVGWVIQCLEDFRDQAACRQPPIAILPVGTGNDLARVLKWGAGYEDQKLVPILDEVMNAEEVTFDRWLVDITSAGEVEHLSMVNYFGVGIDAAIALDFHLDREENPEKFNSRTKNKGRYVMAGVENLVKQPVKDFNSSVTLIGDGQVIKLPELQGIIVLNIESWGAGADLWGKDKDEFAPPSFSDGFLEVVGVYGVMHLSQVSTHLRSGKRLGQFKSIEIRVASEMAVQVDGEPWKQAPATITISRAPHALRFLRKCRQRERGSQASLDSRISLQSESSSQQSLADIQEDANESQANYD